MRPLFQGNSEMDQISKICSVLGSPSNEIWSEGFKHASKKGINFPEYREISLSNVIPGCPSDALSFISECLRWDPSRRASATQLLNHEFLNKEIKSDKKIEENPYLKIDFPEKKESSKKVSSQYVIDKDDEF